MSSGVSRTQPGPRPGQYNSTVNYLDLSPIEPLAPHPSALSNPPPICNCGLPCHCKGCAERLGRDGFPAAAPGCSIGCSSGLGCINDHSPSQIYPNQSHNSALPSSQVNFFRTENGHENGGDASSISSNPSFQFSGASYTSLASSRLDGSMAYSHAPTWSSGTNPLAMSDSSRRTSFAISGEREASLPSLNSHILSDHHSEPSNQYRNSHSSPFSSDHQVASSRFSLSKQQRSSNAVVSGLSQSTSSSLVNSKSSVVKRSIQRLLPRSPLDPAFPTNSSGTSSIDSHSSGQSDRTVGGSKSSKGASGLPTITTPYNRLM